MEEYEAVVQEPGFKDRKARLVVFGILQIILGGFCALMVVLMLVGMVMVRGADKGGGEGVSFKTIIPAVLLYAMSGAWFLSVGIGSVKARRWARSLIVATAWPWLISGLLGFIMMALLLPPMYEQMATSGKMPRNTVGIMEGVMIGFMALFLVVIPGLLAAFYSGRDVKATCEHRDPQVRWTDKCPMPVLSASLITAMWAQSLLWSGMDGWVIPFFGTILGGISGAIVITMLTGLLVYVAWGMYKLDMKAWWAAMLLALGWPLSYYITISRVSMETFYEKMQFSPQMIEMMKHSGISQVSKLDWFFGLWVMVVIGYLVYIKKYFKHTPQDMIQQ